MLTSIRCPDPYPFAVDEAFDAYRVLVESKGEAIGMSGKAFNVIISGDSACVLSLKFRD